MAESHGNKRRVERVQPFIARCRVEAGELRLSAYLLDLSVDGARLSLESAAPPAPGQAVTIEVRLSRSQDVSRLEARVIWAKPEPAPGVCGVDFEGLDGEQRQRIESVLAEFRKRAEQLS